MRLPTFGLGLFCTLALACSTADDSGKDTAGDSSTGDASTGSTTGGTTHHGDTIDGTTDGSGTGTSDSTTDPTTGDDTGTTTDHGTTGHDHTTGTSHDHTTTDPGTTTDHDTTGTNTDACADLDEAKCGAQANCMAIYGSPIDPQLMCLGPKTFAQCSEAAVCGGALTVACHIETKEQWLFPSTCIPDDFAPCDGKPVEQPCK